MVVRKILHGIRFVSGKINLDYVQVSGNEDLINRVKSLQYKGRITPETILQIVRQKLLDYCDIEIRRSAIMMPKEWCERKGVLVDRKSHGFTIFLHPHKNRKNTRE